MIIELKDEVIDVLMLNLIIGCNKYYIKDRFNHVIITNGTIKWDSIENKIIPYLSEERIVIDITNNGEHTVETLNWSLGRYFKCYFFEYLDSEKPTIFYKSGDIITPLVIDSE